MKEISSKLGIFVSILFAFSISMALIFWIRSFSQTSINNEFNPKSDAHYQDLVLDKAVLAIGQKHYSTRCYTCHGLTGKEHYYKGKRVPEIQVQDSQAIYALLYHGIPSKMPALKNRLKPKDIDAIVAYVMWLSEQENL